MAVYYVNSATGSNSNTGTGENSAFATLSKVESLRLQPGDSVLLAAGSVFNEQFDLKYSGSTTAPITIGSYGEGEAPVIHSSAGNGIASQYTSNIVIENIKIADTAGAAIWASNVSNWTVNNVDVEHTGLSGSGSITFRTGQNITIENSRISDVNSDGMWIEKVTGVNLINNTVTNSHGKTADAIQLDNSSNVLISGNTLDQTNAASPKGVLVLGTVQNAVVENNTLLGGGFGISAQAGTNIDIHGNDISGYGGYSWSYAIGLGDQGDARDYTISDNHIHDGGWGVSISAATTLPYIREGIDIYGNTFDHLSNAALKVDRPASGSFHDNLIASDVTPTYISPTIVAAGTFSVSDNQTFDATQTQLASLDSALTADAAHASTDPTAASSHENAKMSPDKADGDHKGLAADKMSHDVFDFQHFASDDSDARGPNSTHVNHGGPHMAFNPSGLDAGVNNVEHSHHQIPDVALQQIDLHTPNAPFDGDGLLL
ncbi:right-handed parallel beta-helix repeat-containing protein [Rhizobium sp. WYJ-E13]|uniref:right-handed parallel beta-helix repeat-containing protein n=1 Tax=Rhizobium sp. WYJ-E13 TaxID=2849093 RepID=UPI001C1ED70E|nr:right-handed parallel beta-helix repeat-containing protein [Rhizobium sp. WYJ-E13]QWW70782.1 right-handed parallel beta-helix repeat-containing protein [Rhizobium sp. WYJ-E13]